MLRTLTIAVLAASAAALSASADPLPGKPSAGEILAGTTAEDWRRIPDDDLLVIDLERGRVVVALSPMLAQAQVGQMQALAAEGFFDGLSFYRVIDGFVAQGGDLLETRKIKTGVEVLLAEFDDPLAEGMPIAVHPDADGYAPETGWLGGLPVGIDRAAGRIWHLHCAGAVAMARDEGRDTARSEFYVALQPQRYLDRNLSVFGRVIDGMQHVQALRRVEPASDPSGDLGETIVRMRPASALPAAERPAFEILDPTRPAFAAWVESRRNRPEAFFYHRPGHADICALTPPVRTPPQQPVASPEKAAQ